MVKESKKKKKVFVIEEALITSTDLKKGAKKKGKGKQK